MIEDEMVGWHHQLNGHEFQQAPGDGEGQGGLACCSPRGRKESDTPERLDGKDVVCSRITWDFMKVQIPGACGIRSLVETLPSAFNKLSQ